MLEEPRELLKEESRAVKMADQSPPITTTALFKNNEVLNLALSLVCLKFQPEIWNIDNLGEEHVLSYLESLKRVKIRNYNEYHERKIYLWQPTIKHFDAYSIISEVFSYFEHFFIGFLVDAFEIEMVKKYPGCFAIYLYFEEPEKWALVHSELKKIIRRKMPTLFFGFKEMEICYLAHTGQGSLTGQTRRR